MNTDREQTEKHTVNEMEYQSLNTPEYYSPNAVHQCVYCKQSSRMETLLLLFSKHCWPSTIKVSTMLRVLHWVDNKNRNFKIEI